MTFSPQIGKQQEYELGKWFRKRYDPLITNGYRFDLLKVNSSDMDRTIMSAECFLAGFFPPNADEMWSENGLKWQPVPIHSIPAESDKVNFKLFMVFHKNYLFLRRTYLRRIPAVISFLIAVLL